MHTIRRLAYLLLLKWVRYSFHRSPINYLLVNLAISDITFAAFVAPNHILKRAFTHPDGAIGSGLCMILTGGNLAWVGAASSSVTLVAIAVERYYTVMCPLGSRGKLTRRKVKVNKWHWIKCMKTMVYLLAFWLIIQMILEIHALHKEPEARRLMIITHSHFLVQH